MEEREGAAGSKLLVYLVLPKLEGTYLNFGPGRVVKDNVTELNITLQMLWDLPFIRGRINDRLLQDYLNALVCTYMVTFNSFTQLDVHQQEEATLNKHSIVTTSKEYMQAGGNGEHSWYSPQGKHGVRSSIYVHKSLQATCTLLHPTLAHPIDDFENSSSSD